MCARRGNRSKDKPASVGEKEKHKDIREHVFKSDFQATDSEAYYELGVTLVAHVCALLAYPYVNPYLWIVFQGSLSLRWFMIFHDCGHGSFFKTMDLNLFYHQISSMFCWTPCYWSHGHRIHHAESGNLSGANKRWHDTIFLTVAEYKKKSPLMQYLYSFVRHPLIFFPCIPFVLWFLLYRVPFRWMPHTKLKDNLTNTMALLVLVAVHVIYASACGVDPWTAGFHLILAGYWGGFWGVVLFQMQHSFNPPYVVREGWKLIDSGIKGSSFIKIPFFLKWFTMGIEYHHIHHYNIKVPGYKLRRCHEAAKEGLWEGIVKLNYVEMFSTLKPTLYDEATGKYI